MGHGIGVKRNDYHRRNRRANISTHNHSSGYGAPAKTAATEAISELHGRTEEKEEWRMVFEQDSDRLHYESGEEKWRDDFMISGTHLYLPPFLSRDEIKRRRFGSDPNDNWWEWEEDLGLTSVIGRPRRVVPD